MKPKCLLKKKKISVIPSIVSVINTTSSKDCYLSLFAPTFAVVILIRASPWTPCWSRVRVLLQLTLRGLIAVNEEPSVYRKQPHTLLSDESSGGLEPRLTSLQDPTGSVRLTAPQRTSATQTLADLLSGSDWLVRLTGPRMVPATQGRAILFAGSDGLCLPRRTPTVEDPGNT